MDRIGQKEKVLTYMQEHDGYITIGEGCRELYLNDPGRIIRFLRKDGYVITDEWFTDPVSDARYKVYHLEGGCLSGGEKDVRKVNCNVRPLS